jgi:hypothetical protein
MRRDLDAILTGFATETPRAVARHVDENAIAYRCRANTEPVGVLAANHGGESNGHPAAPSRWVAAGGAVKVQVPGFAVVLSKRWRRAVAGEQRVDRCCRSVVVMPTATRARQWLDRWDRQQERYVADREERFAVIADVVAATVEGDSPRILDLGCGPMIG